MVNSLLIELQSPLDFEVILVVLKILSENDIVKFVTTYHAIFTKAPFV